MARRAVKISANGFDEDGTAMNSNNKNKIITQCVDQNEKFMNEIKEEAPKPRPDVSLVLNFQKLLRSKELEELKCMECGTPSAFSIKLRDHPRYVYIDGEMYLPDFKPRPVRSALTIIPLATDILVAGYPKCGNTWTQNICAQLLDYDISGGWLFEFCTVLRLFLKSPMPEQFGAEFVEAMPRPRMLKLHYAYDKSLMSLNGRFVFVARNPKDCIVSGYHHVRRFRNLGWPDGDFNIQYEYFINGLVPYGDYFDHLLSWLPHIHKPNVLFLKYEDMFEDLEGAVRKIGKFLGGRAAEVIADKEQLQKIVESCTLESMKKDQSRWFPAFTMSKHEFVRKGGSRGWKNYFSREQSDRVDEMFRKRLAGTEAAGWWKREMAWENDDNGAVNADEAARCL